MHPLQLSLLALLLAPRAWAGGYSIDAELLEPMLSEGDLPGLDGARALGTGSARAGLLYQYVSRPVTLHTEGAELGAPVWARATVFAGVSADFGGRVTARAVLPVAMQEGQGITGLDADGVGTADLRLGMRALLPGGEAARAGLDVELYLPTGTEMAWLGEEAPRLRMGGVSGLSVGPIKLLGDGGVLLRRSVDTGMDMVSGSELYANAGLSLRWRRLEAYGVALGRVGMSRGVSLEGRAALEGLGGLQVGPIGPTRLELGVGRGLAEGLGSSEWRAMASLRVERRRDLPTSERDREGAPRVGRAPEVRVDELSDEPAAARVVFEPPEEAPEPVWEEGELARVRLETASIEIREPIQFEFGTDRILPISIPTLHAVAGILAEHPEIEALVIEGHASEEGSYLYNYDLAYRRCGAIFRELVSAGVHPYRLSTRSMGEVVPKSAGQDEQSLAANRRVEFHIVRQRHPLEPDSPLAPVTRPWDGAPLAASAQEGP